MNIFQKQIKVLAVVAILGLTSSLSANDLADSLKKNSIYVGFQSSWPSYGISAKMDIKEKISVQGIIGLLGTVNSYSVRGIYKFQQKQFYNLYGFGSVGPGMAVVTMAVNLYWALEAELVLSMT